MKIGVLGGTFDPIHVGHLLIAQEAYFRFQLDKVIFIPNHTPPHKENEPGASCLQRAQMVGLAIEGNPAFELSEIEISRKGPSYSIDTVRELKGRYPEECSVFFITGMDSLIDLVNWKEPGKLLSECTFVVASRPGYTHDELDSVLPLIGNNGKPVSDSIRLMPVSGVDVSSSSIRERVASGGPFRYLVPDAVWRYITDERLYL